MAKIAILDLAFSHNPESFITELNGLSEPDKASLMSNIIGGSKLKVKYNDDGSIKSIKYKDWLLKKKSLILLSKLSS